MKLVPVSRKKALIHIWTRERERDTQNVVSAAKMVPHFQTMWKTVIVTIKAYAAFKPNNCI